jgi:hypothetical protein
MSFEELLAESTHAMDDFDDLFPDDLLSFLENDLWTYEPAPGTSNAISKSPTISTCSEVVCSQFSPSGSHSTSSCPSSLFTSPPLGMAIQRSAGPPTRKASVPGGTPRQLLHLPSARCRSECSFCLTLSLSHDSCCCGVPCFASYQSLRGTGIMVGRRAQRG